LLLGRSMKVLVRDKRMGPIVWLLAAACAQGIAFWYPAYIANKYPSSDGDGRYFIVPEIVVGTGVVALACLVLLVRRLVGHSRTGNAAVLVFAVVVNVIALFPILKLFVR